MAERDAAREFSVEAYRNSTIEIADNAIVASRAGAGATGVRIRLGSRGWGRRFVVEARVDGPDDARLRLNGRAGLRYLAPQGDEHLAFVLGGDVTEGLLYSQSADQIHVRVERIADCAEGRHDLCFTVDDLRQEVFPEGEPSASRDRLLALLDWSANAADYAATPELAAEAGRAVGRHSATQMYSSFYRHNRVGGFCGATAVFFAGLLREMGYEAAAADFGVPDTTTTHVTTLVRDPSDGEFYLLDATFNFYIVRRDTRALATYREVLTLPPEQLEIVERSLDERDYLVPIDAFANDRAFFGHGGFERCRRDRRAGHYVCRDPSFSLDQFIVSSASAMVAAGFPATREGFLLMLRGRYFRVTAPPETQDSLIALLAEAGVDEPRRN